jgi:hypothetical protein
MFLSIVRMTRSGLVIAVSLIVMGALTLPAAGAASSAGAPSPRSGMGIAYDFVRDQVVLFGGGKIMGGGTWIWDGSSWSQLTPAHWPSARHGMGMVYDAARAQVVLFGGVGDAGILGETWTWDGTDWTKLHPVHSPRARYDMGMAFDAARAEVVLFSGNGGLGVGLIRDTWAWDGTDWRQLSPRHSPPPRYGMGMAYDAARAQIVLFGGNKEGDLNDTWRWDGTDWKHLSPAHSPSTRYWMGMAYDAARAEVTLFGGWGTVDSHVQALGDGWTWNGADWTRLSPPHSPSPRASLGMAGDTHEAGTVLFGGYNGFAGGELGDTWTWDGADWTLVLAGSISLHPASGPPGAHVRVDGWGFAQNETVKLWFLDSVLGRTFLRKVQADSTGAFRKQVTIPLGATLGVQLVTAKGLTSGQLAEQPLTLT